MKLSLLFAIVLGVFISTVKSALIGIDFGSDFYKISLIAPGKSFVIVESMASHRKVNTAISYYQKKRFYENDAVSKRTRFPHNSFVFVRELLGALESDEEVFRVSKANYDEYLMSFAEGRGTVQFELKNFKFEDDDEDNDVIILRVEEVVGQIFRYAKMLSEKMAGSGTDIKDCVITVPVHWNFNQRMSLTIAAQLSGLVPLQLISDNTAAGLYYAVERMDEDPHLVLFYNIGSTNLQASLIEYKAVNSTKKVGNSTKTIESVNVLADYGIPYVGGFYYDKVIAEYFAEQIDARPDRKGKPSMKENKRAMRKMIRESVKTKEILSANKEAHYGSEGLVDGQDYRGSITREEFEKRSQHLLDQLTIPIQKVLERSGKNMTDINVVEILGGGTRIPKIQEIVKNYIGDVELGSHMNGDESMALGASFHCANFSGSFRVRDVLLSDGYNFEVRAEIKNLEDVPEDAPEYYYKNFTLFPYKKRFGTKKTVNFANKNNLQINLFAVDYEGNETLYTTLNLTDIDRVQNDKHFNTTLKPKVFLEFEIHTINGINLNDAQVKFNYTASEKVTKDEIKKMEKERERLIRKAERERKKKAKKDGEEVNNDEPITIEEPKWDEDVYEVVDGENVTLYRNKNKTRALDIKIVEELAGIQPYNKTEYRKGQRIIKRFDFFEEKQRNLSDIKNKFESYVYEVRDMVLDEYFIKYSKDAERQDLTKLQEENVEWLDSDEAFHGNYTVYSNRLGAMQNISFPVLRRLDEARYRPEYINKTGEAIADFQKKVSLLEKDHKWLNESDIAPLKALINETITNVTEKIAAQKEMPLNEDPVFSIRELKPMLDEINKEYMKVRNIKEPKKVDTEKKAKKPKGKKQTINIDGEEVEFDFESLKKQKEFKDFDFEKFQEQMKKKREQEEKEAKQKADQESEDIENSQEEEGNSQQEQNEEKDDL